jgi:transcriptional regulator with XRE-family HTH domain
MNSILKQLKQRRISLGLRQQDMLLQIGVSRQQYQRLESRGNPRLDTLQLIAQGLKSQLVLVPLEKLNAVQAIMNKEALTGESLTSTKPN